MRGAYRKVHKKKQFIPIMVRQAHHDKGNRSHPAPASQTGKRVVGCIKKPEMVVSYFYSAAIISGISITSG